MLFVKHQINIIIFFCSKVNLSTYRFSLHTSTFQIANLCSGDVTISYHVISDNKTVCEKCPDTELSDDSDLSNCKRKLSVCRKYSPEDYELQGTYCVYSWRTYKST